MLNGGRKEMHIRSTVSLIIISDLEIAAWIVELIGVQHLLRPPIQTHTEHARLISDLIRESAAHADVADSR